jgi:cytochrome c
VKIAIAVILALGIGLAGYIYLTGDNTSVPVDLAGDESGKALVEITVPATLSNNAQIGQMAFETKCAACHGTNAVGQGGVAPPLIHKIYEPSHHGDEAFQRAAAIGVRTHHWPFGDMPPVEGLTRGDVIMIVAYIRELQRANGIN